MPEVTTGMTQLYVRSAVPLAVESVSAHEIFEALEPARCVRPVGDGVLIAELALERGAD